MLARSNRRKPATSRPQTEVHDTPHANMTSDQEFGQIEATTTIKASTAGSRFAPIADSTEHAIVEVYSMSIESEFQQLRDRPTSDI